MCNTLGELISYFYFTIKDSINLKEIFCQSDNIITVSCLPISPQFLKTLETIRVSHIVNFGLKIKWHYLPFHQNGYSSFRIYSQ